MHPALDQLIGPINQAVEDWNPSRLVDHIRSLDLQNIEEETTLVYETGSSEIEEAFAAIQKLQSAILEGATYLVFMGYNVEAIEFVLNVLNSNKVSDDHLRTGTDILSVELSYLGAEYIELALVSAETIIRLGHSINLLGTRKAIEFIILHAGKIIGKNPELAEHCAKAAMNYCPEKFDDLKPQTLDLYEKTKAKIFFTID